MEQTSDVITGKVADNDGPRRLGLDTIVPPGKKLRSRMTAGGNAEDVYDEIVKPFAKNAAALPPVLQVDRECAAGGVHQNETLKAIK